jgi:acetone carboxylase alpha subunit
MVKVDNVNVPIRKDPSKFDLSMEKVMNEQPFEGGRYSTYHMGLQFDVAKDGELYMISQGAGGGYGDPLERDPQSVVKDAELNRISAKVARDLFAVVYDQETFRLDAEATAELRTEARKDRLQRGRPYQEFVDEWVTAEPPAELLYYGSWGDDTDKLTATVFEIDGPRRVTATIDEMPIIMVPDRREVKIAKLESRLAELEARHGENVRRLA